jgi:murein DD-endopeptidase MepM/ murein hydrolase activator NlpD
MTVCRADFLRVFILLWVAHHLILTTKPYGRLQGAAQTCKFYDICRYVESESEKEKDCQEFTEQVQAGGHERPNAGRKVLYSLDTHEHYRVRRYLCPEFDYPDFVPDCIYALAEYIPGYTDVTIRRNLVAVALKTDSVENQLNAQEAYLANLLNVLNDKVDTTQPVKNFSESALNDTLRKLDKSEEDSLMRLQMEGADRFELNESNERSFSTGIGSIAFFTPLKGSITTKFNPVQKHFGIDIVAGPNEVIKSSLDGTVVISSFTSETGYVIGVQHTNNIFTLYKHNSALLKSVGDYVKAGEVIAIIGNTGEFSTGPHLHFELWYNGSPVNPLEYISF